MLPYKIHPWKHQREAVEIASRRSSYALFFEMGTGKTATAINILRNWSADKGALLNTIIFCPPIVIDQWAEEFSRHSNIASSCIVRLKGSGSKRLKLLKEAQTAKRPKIYITNYETLLMDKIYAQLQEMGLEVAIFDESHKLKSIKAKRTKRATVLADLIKRKLILTGSPVLNSPMDVFSQFRILDGGKTFGNNFFIFRARYFYDANAGMPKHRHFPNWVPRKNCHKEIRDLVRTTAMRVEKSACLDLPPLVRQEVPIEMSKEQSRAYEEMKKDLITYIEEKEKKNELKAAVANMALTKALRLQQIISGFVRVDDSTDHEFKDIPRIKILGEILDDLVDSHKVIIWASFHSNYKAIGALLEKKGIQYVEIHGLKSEKQKTEAVKSFREDPATKVLICNPKAGGVGLNLTSASYSIYFSRGYSLEDDLQSEARNYRGGSEIHKKITRIDLVTKGTIDEIILQALKNKQNLAEKILAIKEQLKLM
jgi:SNF2 family DNA or RNA helicase